MTIPILSTKLYIPPPRPDLVPRQRLIQKLNAGISRKLTLVSAPAGFGKTTLLSKWVAQIDSRRVAWYAVDAGDNDLIRFLTYTISALQKIDKNLGADLLAALQSSSAEELESIMTELLNEISETVFEMILVFDDFHLLESQAIYDALSYLIEYLPGNMHLVISTRVDPALPLARLRARREMNELRTANLRFNRDESASLLNRIAGLDLAPEDIDALESRTEGWIAGLQLAAISLQEQEDRSKFIRTFSGSHHHILEYLIDEVLNQQPPDIQKFLVQTSILERLTAPLCLAVCDCDPGDGNEETLNGLAASNLFLIPLDDERQWYRYHHLFAELLQHRLLQIYPEQIDDLQKRASSWYEKKGLIREAISHALQVEKKDLAGDLIERHASLLLYQGSAQIHELLTWYEKLPDQLIQDRPLLRIYLAKALAFDGPFRHRSRVLELVDLVQSQLEAHEWDKSTEDTAAGLIASLQGLYSSPPLKEIHDPEKVLTLLDRALELLPATEANLRADLFNGKVYEYMHLEDTASAIDACRSAFQEAAKAGNQLSTIISLRNQSVVTYHQGNLEEAIDLCQKGLDLLGYSADEKNVQPGFELLFTSLGYLYIERGDGERAVIELKKGIRSLRLVNEYEATLMAYIALVRHLMIIGDAQQALEICSQLESDRPVFSHLASVLRIQVEITRRTSREKTDQTIREWLGEYQSLPEALTDFRGISPQGETRHLAHMTWIQAQCFLTNQDQNPPDGSVMKTFLEYLDKRIANAESSELIYRVIECSVYKALVLDTMGERERALSVLEKALPLAESHGFIRVLTDKGNSFKILLQDAQKRGLSTSFLPRLLQVYEDQERPDPSAQADYLGRADQPKPTWTDQRASLTDREKDVLILMAEGMTYNEIADKIMVSLNTVRTHVKNIYGKLGVNKRSQAIAAARKRELL